MKLKKQIGLVLCALALTSVASFATVTINTQFGVATDSSGNPVPDGTLWALIVDGGTVGAMPGGLSLNTGLNSSSIASLDASFLNANFTLGTSFGGDTIFALGGFNGEGILGVTGSTTNGIAGLSLGTNGLVAGSNFAFYFFPGVTFTTEGAIYTANGQVGGINRTTADAGAGTVGMVVPNDGSQIFAGASTNAGGDLGGDTPAAQFQAQNLTVVPEPSSALLGALGVLGLLRRRRN